MENAKNTDDNWKLSKTLSSQLHLSYTSVMAAPPNVPTSP